MVQMRIRASNGVLFRAVEYVQWLEENCEALQAEVDRVESFTGVKG